MGVPLFFVCRNPACRKVVRVKTPKQQRERQCCGPRCVAIMFSNLTPELRRKGGLTRGHNARVKIRARVDSMRPIDAFRYGYRLGLGSKTRQLQRASQRRTAA